MDLRTTNPELYANITSGHHPPRLPANEDAISEVIDMEGNEDVEHSVGEVCQVVLNACTAGEAARPLGDFPEYEDEQESEDAAIPPPIPIRLTRSGRAPRPSSRYKSANWEAH